MLVHQIFQDRPSLIRPTHLLVLPANETGLRSSSDIGEVMGNVIAKMYDIPQTSLFGLEEISLLLGVELVAAASCASRILEPLGWIGTDEQFIPASRRPPDEVANLLASAVEEAVGPGARCCTNVDETGGMTQVSPRPIERSEIAVVFFSDRATCAFYWGQDLD